LDCITKKEDREEKNGRMEEWKDSWNTEFTLQMKRGDGR
jgi:surfactin synthase thioesterase subunit